MSATASATGTAPAKKGLSKGAKIGIGVGVGVVAATVLAGALALCLRPRRGKDDSDEHHDGPPAPVHQGGFLHQIQEKRQADTNGAYGGGGDSATADNESF